MHGMLRTSVEVSGSSVSLRCFRRDQARYVPWTRASVAVLVPRNAASVKHLRKDPLGLVLYLRLGLQLGVLLDDLVEHRELILNSLLLSNDGELVVLDLLLGPSALAADLHEVCTGALGF